LERVRERPRGRVVEVDLGRVLCACGELRLGRAESKLVEYCTGTWRADVESEGIGHVAGLRLPWYRTVP
jgi:hypothetical protein